MNEFQIQTLADEVLAAFEQTVPPVNLQHIAAEEAIELVDGDFGEDFQGRIEFLVEVEAFAIYHPRLDASLYPPRVRFSIAHELGHFYIPEHREMLMRGISHNSLEGFHHADRVEHEADVFASALLVPAAALRERMGRRGFLNLQQVLDLAADCEASAQAAAFRYTRFTTEPHLAIVSANGSILYYFVSEEAKAIGFGGLGNRNVPENSPTHRAGATVVPRIEEGKTETERWFSERRARADLWEEAIRLGNSQRVLTLLSWVNYDPHHPQWDE